METNRVARTSQQLRDAFIDQVDLLQIACSSFDGGRHVTARNMATHLRTLLLEPTKKSSRSVPLLRHIGVPPRFLSLAFSIRQQGLSILQGPDEPRGTAVPVCGLVNVRMHSAGATFFAPLDDVPENASGWLPYADWWAGTAVIRDYRGREFTRLDVVRHVADTDGGAHVDPSLDGGYAALKDGISLGWAVINDEAKTYLRQLELHCLRQITHEFLATIARHTPWAFRSPYPRPQHAVGIPEGATMGAFMAVHRGVRFEMGESVIMCDA